MFRHHPAVIAIEPIQGRHGRLVYRLRGPAEGRVVFDGECRGAGPCRWEILGNGGDSIHFIRSVQIYLCSLPDSIQALS